MSEWLLSHTALPNLHPAVVHFPIALLVAAIGFDGACLLLRRQAWLDRCAASLYALGALGAWAAFLAGGAAEEGLTGLSAEVGELVEQHEEWALRAVIAFALVGIARLAIAWRARHEGETRALALRVPVLLAALVGLWLLYETAERGGALVYQHAVAVGAPGKPAAAGPAAGPD